MHHQPYDKFALHRVPPTAAKPLILELPVNSTHLLTAAQQSDCSQCDHRNGVMLKTQLLTADFLNWQLHYYI